MADEPAALTLFEEQTEEPVPAETEEQALALNAEGLRHWLREVLKENARLESDIQLSRAARVEAAELCQRGTPKAGDCRPEAAYPLQNGPGKLGKRSKKRKAALFGNFVSVPGQTAEEAQEPGEQPVQEQTQAVESKAEQPAAKGPEPATEPTAPPSQPSAQPRAPSAPEAALVQQLAPPQAPAKATSTPAAASRAFSPWPARSSSEIPGVSSSQRPKVRPTKPLKSLSKPKQSFHQGFQGNNFSAAGRPRLEDQYIPLDTAPAFHQSQYGHDFPGRFVPRPRRHY